VEAHTHDSEEGDDDDDDGQMPTRDSSDEESEYMKMFWNRLVAKIFGKGGVSGEDDEFGNRWEDWIPNFIGYGVKFCFR
jgi:hypothetical protein